MKSIIQNEKISFLSGRGDTIEEHHVFGGQNRKLSEKYGLKIYLTAEEHRGKDGIHNNRELSDEVKAKVQEIAMDYYGWDIDEFRFIFGKNYV